MIPCGERLFSQKLLISGLYISRVNHDTTKFPAPRSAKVLLNPTREGDIYIMTAPNYLPRARKQQLITKEVGGELIVYDRESDRVHCLNSTAAFVWTHCDGQTSVATMAKLLEEETKVPVEQDLVLYALEQLNKSELLDDSYAMFVPERAISRRAVMRVGVAAALAVPLISSIVAPTAAQAASCLPDGSVCASDGACCSNNCVDNGRGSFQCA